MTALKSLAVASLAISGGQGFVSPVNRQVINSRVGQYAPVANPIGKVSPDRVTDFRLCATANDGNRIPPKKPILDAYLELDDIAYSGFKGFSVGGNGATPIVEAVEPDQTAFRLILDYSKLNVLDNAQARFNPKDDADEIRQLQNVVFRSLVGDDALESSMIKESINEHLKTLDGTDDEKAEYLFRIEKLICFPIDAASQDGVNDEQFLRRFMDIVGILREMSIDLTDKEVTPKTLRAFLHELQSVRSELGDSRKSRDIDSFPWGKVQIDSDNVMDYAERFAYSTPDENADAKWAGLQLFLRQLFDDFG